MFCTRWKYLLMGMAMAVLATGCRIEVAQDNNQNNSKKKVVAAKPKVSKSATSDPVTYQVRNSSSKETTTRRDFKNDSPPRSFSSGSSGSSGESSAFSGGTRTSGAATQKVVGVINDSLELGPTLVVWVLDVTDSAFSLSGSMNTEIRNLYDRLATKPAAGDAAKNSERLLTAIVTFGNDVMYPLETPVNNKAEVASVFEKLKADKTDREMTFAAVSGAVDKFISFRTQKNYQLMIVVVTDEAGDDTDAVDGLIPKLDKYAIPVYAIGASAPFGKIAAAPGMSQNSFMNDRSGSAPSHKTRQGPESRYLEFVDIPSLSSNYSNNTLDSGFGPFHLEYLCRSTGGAFLSASSISSRSSVRGEADLMQKYAPDYISEAEYQSALNKNRAKLALHKAATMKHVETMAAPRTDFYKKNEADLAKIVNEAQKPPAKIQPQIQALYDILADGEKDRENLTSPRWQASYDLAMGRIAALRANVDGYNSMLALLKRKSGFQNANSSTWVLEPAESIEGDSTLAKLILKSKMYLQRVIDQHPGTPWAVMAERDLKTPLGWKWDER